MKKYWYKNKMDLRSWNFNWSTKVNYRIEPSIYCEMLKPTEFWSIPSFVNEYTVVIGGWDHILRCYNLKKMNLDWELKLTSPIYSSPAIINEKSFILGGEDGILRRINIVGEIEWEFKAKDRIHSTPTVSHCKSVVFVTCYDHHVYALDTNTGECLWSKIYNEQIEEDIYSSPSLTESNDIIFGTGEKVICINNNGQELWTFSTNGDVDSTPALDYENKIGVIGSNGNLIYGFNTENGDILWEYETGGPVNTSAAISNGTVAIGSDDGYMYALNILNGSLVWKKYNDGKKMLYTPLTVLPDGNFVYVTLEECLYCVDHLNGQEIWKKKFPRGVHSAPGISSNGYMAIGSNWGAFYFLTFVDVNDYSHDLSLN
ncbi:PQQ-binding-like beta-propeller repeat protein [Paenibacillus faecalis]|uniref:outer membrane protein assembly factor BamB family protein n=1 Tax=Paenibacillus faecalis TaxID=2079532 RepID=UPI000D1001D4|nr:PQQ-binding-like beta-propeller repeat protein [Paenibacillus faecalis]